MQPNSIPNESTNHFPLVTVGHLCYNTGSAVIEAIQSVLDNQYPNIQHIVLDDCSEDNSYSLIKAFIATTGTDIMLLRNESNKGITKSINRILKLAQGEYYLTVADDILMQGKIEADVQILEECPDHCFAVASLGQRFNSDPHNPSNSFHGSHRLFNQAQYIEPQELLNSLYERNWICAPTVMIKTAHLLQFQYPEDYFIEDYPYWVSNTIKGYSIYYRPEATILYRRNHNSISGQHRHSITSLKINKDVIRCKLEIASETRRQNAIPAILRDGIYLLQHGDHELVAWYLDLIRSFGLKGILYYSSKVSRNRYWLRLAWYLSRHTKRV